MKNILIIDDSDTVTMQFQVFFEKNGMHVDIANSVEEGLKKFYEKNYDIVTIDLLMPTEDDGINLLKTLKSAVKSGNMSTIIIVVSAVSESSKKKICLDIGADDYVEKNEHCNEEILNIIKTRI